MQLCIWEISEDNTLVQRNYQRIRHVWREITSHDGRAPEEADFVCLLGNPARTVVYDISLPASLKRSMEREVLFEELTVRLPVPRESVCWFYRACGDGKFRVCAVHREEMARLLEFARLHSLKFDLVIPAALAETPETILQVVPGETLPEDFRPIRCRGLKNLCLGLFALTVVLLGVVISVRYQDFARERDRLAGIRAIWEKELREERRQFGELSADQELLQELRTAKLDTPFVLPVLRRLTSGLPKTMWVTNYSQNYDSADLTLSASKDEPNLYRLIGENETYAIMNLRKSRGYNNTVSFFVKLRIRH